METAAKGRAGAEAAADARLALLASIVDSCNDAVVSRNLDGLVTSWNPAAERMYGYAAGEILGKPLAVLQHADRPDEMAGVLAEIRAGRRVGPYDTVRRRRDGSSVSVSLTISPTFDAEGALAGASSIARDIGERRDAEDLARTSLQYARSLIRASPDLLVTISPEGKITDVNEGSIKVTGEPRADLLGTDFCAHFTEPDRASEACRQVFASGSVTDFPLTIRHKDGRLTDVLYNASVYKDADGTALGMFAAARDVTDQKQASLYARSLIEASLDPLVMISPEGKITDVNAGAVKVTGVPREKLVGTDFFDYFTEPARAREGYQQVFEKGFVTDYPLTFRHRDGHLTDVLYNASVYRDARGGVLGVFAAARDVTAQKRAEAVIAEQQSRELGRSEDLERFQKQYARSLIEASPDPLVTISPEGRITDVNEGTIGATGVPREKLIGTDFCDYFTEPVRAREGYQRVFEKGIVTDFPLTIRHRDGRLTEVLYSASLYKDARGGVLGVFAAARDVTAQKRAEAVIADQQSREIERVTELEQVQKQYARSLIEASPDPLVTISPEGRITDVNEGTIGATGVPREKLIGTDFCDYFTEPVRAREGYQRVFEKGIVTDFPLTIRHRDGRLTEVLYSASLYKDARGGVLGVFAAARDVTAQKRAEAVIADQRGKELERIADLERFQKLTVGRELKMIELKREIEELKKGPVAG